MSGRQGLRIGSQTGETDLSPMSSLSACCMPATRARARLVLSARLTASQPSRKASRCTLAREHKPIKEMAGSRHRKRRISTSVCWPIGEAHSRGCRGWGADGSRPCAWTKTARLQLRRARGVVPSDSHRALLEDWVDRRERRLFCLDERGSALDMREVRCGFRIDFGGRGIHGVGVNRSKRVGVGGG